MDKFRNWALNFMKGRYGYDELGRFLSIAVIVVIIASIVFGILAMIFSNLLHLGIVANVLNILSTLTNWVAMALLIYSFFRMLSRNHEKRRAENARFLSKRSGRSKQRETKRENKNYKFLTCQFCGQKMRVPKGKGKIAVKCPACGEKTIFNS